MDYESLRFIWWLLIGVLLIGFVITDGFDMGVGVLLRVVGKTDEERRVLINSVAPHWDGNQVWFITAGGALFAAWPMVYATAFSGFYIAMMLTLFALFLRPMAFDYRSKLEKPEWRNSWDRALTVGSLVPPLIFGVAFGNLLQGVPFHFDDILRVYYTGSFLALLNPFALLAGVLSVLMVANHGAAWLQLKTLGQLRARSERLGTRLSLICALLFTLGGVWLWLGIDGYQVTSIIDTNGINKTLDKTVEVTAGAWFANYVRWPLLWLVPLIGIIAFLICAWGGSTKRHVAAFTGSAIAMASVIGTGLTLFPFIMPSSSVPAHSLTLWDSTSSETTLFLMFVVACVFIPLILAYTCWSYFVMRGRLDEQHIRDNSHSLY